MKVSQKLFHTAITILLFLFSLGLYGNTSLNDSAKTDVVNSIIKFNIKKLNSFGTLDKIVIDAGHGGKDHGCSGAHSKEKFIVLDIALKLGDLIRFYHPEIEIIYTRNTDVFIPLDTRIGIANSQQADLFISIHANYIHKKHVHGTETYVMGLHRAEENLAVAKRENAAILYETDYQSTYGGYDPNSPEAHILLSMFQNSFLEKSINFATKVENSFTKRTVLHSRGVKQAGFLVLRKATMPSTLIETGFLSSRDDEAYLMSDTGQNEVASAILKAITEYKREIEGEYWATESNELSNVNDNSATNIQNHPSARPENTASELETLTSPTQSTYSGPIENDHQTNQISKHPEDPNSETQTITNSIHKTYSGATGYSPTHETSKHPVVSTPKSVNEKVNTTTLESGTYNKIYKIQIAAGIKKLIKSSAPTFSDIDDLEIRKEDNMYKYLTGHFEDLNEAFSAREIMRNKGFKGAFIVSYVDNVRVTF